MISSVPLSTPIEEQLHSLHRTLQVELPPITRVAVAVYDRKTDRLRTFAHSTEGESPLPHYETRLSEVPSLKALAERRADRVVDDLTVFAESEAEHSRAFQGRWEASYTKPIFEGDRLRGFIFFDATEKAFFSPAVVQRLGVYAEFIALMLANSLFPARMIKSVVHVAAEVTHSRDPETGAHLDRMSRYARVIAEELAEAEGFSDAFVYYLYMFAPLHDIGKVAIPDHILLKPGRLTDEELVVMRTHTVRGAEMIERVLTDLGSESLPHESILRAVVRHHHEAWNGTGYPDGLAGGAIPIEARIVTVADVFDALTTARPYKEAWPSEHAFAFLRDNAGRLFDPDCVRALEARRDDVEAIRARFTDAESATRLHEGYSHEL
ncbi:MAG TPA: HD domain-containing protein [Sandaracinaceae bacterium LLY-WYZ-13_1]|nr:HD domain-containing protein [Sandaracinaceae bacterium LLY-WYZ-13_1]